MDRIPEILRSGRHQEDAPDVNVCAFVLSVLIVFCGRTFETAKLYCDHHNQYLLTQTAISHCLLYNAVSEHGHGQEALDLIKAMTENDLADNIHQNSLWEDVSGTFPCALEVARRMIAENGSNLPALYKSLSAFAVMIALNVLRDDSETDSDDEQSEIENNDEQSEIENNDEHIEQFVRDTYETPMVGDVTSPASPSQEVLDEIADTEFLQKLVNDPCDCEVCTRILESTQRVAEDLILDSNYVNAILGRQIGDFFSQLY